MNRLRQPSPLQIALALSALVHLGLLTMPSPTRPARSHRPDWQAAGTRPAIG